MILLQLSKIVGTSTEGGWSQAHTFIPAEPEKISRRGQLLVVISLNGGQERSDAVVLGREIMARFHGEYYGHLAGSSLEQLEKALKKAAAGVEEKAELEIVAASLVGEVLYLAVLGQGEVVLSRGKKMAVLLSGDGSASGHLQEGDVFLLGTGKIFAVIAEEDLQAALAADLAEEVVEILTSLIHAHEDGGAIAGLVARVETSDREIKRSRDQAIEPQRGYEAKKQRDYGTMKLREWLTKVSPFLIRIKRRMKREAIYLAREREKKRRSQKTVISVALILLFILAVSVALGRQQRKRLAQKGQLAGILQEAQSKKEEGEALLSLNPLRAKELLLEAQALIQTIEPENASNQAVVEFEEDLAALLPQVLREHQVKPTVFFDLELIKEGARGHDWDFSAANLFILDKEKSTAYNLGIDDRKSAILAGGQELEGASQITALLPRVFILADQGVIQVKKDSKSQALVIGADEDWGEIIDFYVFGGNLYLLDKKARVAQTSESRRGEIWKYLAIEDGFGARQAWLKNKVEADFSKAVSMAIDGAIWILESDGTISKYIQGQKEAFGVAGLDKPFSNPSALYTDSEQDYLYILDKGNSRVIVLAKSGEYDSQYYWPASSAGGEGIGEIDNLIASEEAKKILLLGGSKVYEIEMATR